MVEFSEADYNDGVPRTIVLKDYIEGQEHACHGILVEETFRSTNALIVLKDNRQSGCKVCKNLQI